MKVIDVYNPDQALSAGLSAIIAEGALCGSRNGPVIRFKTPVTSVYHRPIERVSFNPVRDANPFLHLMEALWMLAGRNDVEFAGYYAKQMLTYSDDGKTLNAAYGYRWRNHFGHDQIEDAISILKSDANSRQVVIQIWDHEDLMKTSKDKACNTSVMFDAQLGVLNMTVTNRSNDMIWGAYGANAVHFSMLHEYVANRAGLPIGTYFQVSNNLHVYTEFEISTRFLGRTNDSADGQLYVKAPPFSANQEVYGTEDLYRAGIVEPLSMGAFFDDWDAELQDLVANYRRPTQDRRYFNVFFNFVCEPLRCAYVLWKEGKKEEAAALLEDAHQTYFAHMNTQVQNDWLLAGQNWMARRLKAVA